MRVKLESTPAFPASFPVDRLGRTRPEPCLDLELQERFLGRKVPLCFWQRPGESDLGEEAMILLGLGTERPALDGRFLGDVRAVIYNWLVFWSAFRRPEVRAAFRVEVGAAPGGLFEVRPVPGNLDVPFILAALRRNGACLKPTLH